MLVFVMGNESDIDAFCQYDSTTRLKPNPSQGLKMP